MPIKLPHLPYIKEKDQRIYETFKSLEAAYNLLVQQVGISTGRVPPPQIQSISVVAANGIFSVSITDNSANHLGIRYFIEYSQNASFNPAYTEVLVDSRNKNGWNLGSGTWFFRAFSQYQNSDPGPRVYFGGSTPTGVGGGGSAGPTLPASQGSGSGSGGGFGQGGTGIRQRPPNLGRLQ
jgi:hypothetical protein